MNIIENMAWWVIGGVFLLVVGVPLLIWSIGFALSN